MPNSAVPYFYVDAVEELKGSSSQLFCQMVSNAAALHLRVDYDVDIIAPHAQRAFTC
jgi:hypothetical protein